MSIFNSDCSDCTFLMRATVAVFDCLANCLLHYNGHETKFMTVVR